MNFGEQKVLNAKVKYSYLGFDAEKKLYLKIGFIAEDGEYFATTTDLSKVPSILNVLDLQSWEEVPRKYCRIEKMNDYVLKVGNLIENRWVKFYEDKAS